MNNRITTKRVLIAVLMLAIATPVLAASKALPPPGVCSPGFWQSEQ
jgi:hypothetical protein